MLHLGMNFFVVPRGPDKDYGQGHWLCGSVGRALASNIRVPRFESSHWQKFIYVEHLFTVNCVLK